MKKILILGLANTVIFTFAVFLGIAIWKVLLAEIILFFVWNALRSWGHPAHQLVKQASHMNWRAVGTSKDEEGYRDTLLERNGVIARVSFRKKCVFLAEPESVGPYKDFLEVERALAQQQSLDSPVGKARAALTDIEASDEIPGLSSAKNEVLELLRDVEKTTYSINEDKIDPRSLVYLLIHSVTLKALCTGDNHVYRGVLSMRGNLLLQAYEAASQKMTEGGLQDENEHKKGLAALKQEISEIG